MALAGRVFHVEFGLNETQLTQALESHDYAAAERLIRNRSYTSYLDEGCYRRTPLYIVLCGVEEENEAARARNFYIARLLIEYGASLNHRVPETFYGCEYLSPGKTALELLVDFYDDLTHFTPSMHYSLWPYLADSWDPHHECVIGLNNTLLGQKSDVIDDIEELLFLLIANGSDTGLHDEERQTCLHRTCINSSEPRVLRLLTENGANVNAVDVRGNTPLISLCDITASDLCDFFDDLSPCSEVAEPEMSLDVKHDFLAHLLACPETKINHQNHLGQTALFHCVIRGDVRSCLTLLEAGADTVIRGTVWKSRRIKRKLSPLFVTYVSIPSQHGLTFSNVISHMSAAPGRFSHLVDAGYFMRPEITSELHEIIATDFPEFSHLQRIGSQLTSLMFGRTTRTLRQAAAAVIFQSCLERLLKISGKGERLSKASESQSTSDICDYIGVPCNVNVLGGDESFGVRAENFHVENEFQFSGCVMDPSRDDEESESGADNLFGFNQKQSMNILNQSYVDDPPILCADLNDESNDDEDKHNVNIDQLTLDRDPSFSTISAPVTQSSISCERNEELGQRCRPSGEIDQDNDNIDDQIKNLIFNSPDSELSLLSESQSVRNLQDDSGITSHQRGLPDISIRPFNDSFSHPPPSPPRDTDSEISAPESNEPRSIEAELSDDPEDDDEDDGVSINQPISVTRHMVRDLISSLGLPRNVQVNFDIELLRCLFAAHFSQYRVLPPSGIVSDRLGFYSEPDDSYSDDSDSAVGRDEGDSDLEYW